MAKATGRLVVITGARGLGVRWPRAWRGPATRSWAADDRPARSRTRARRPGIRSTWPSSTDRRPGGQGLGRAGPRRARAPDLLLNNAALINANAPLWTIPAAEFDRVIDVNIKGIANVIRHFVPAMVARGSGVIVNLSSGWGRSTSPDVAPYCATKWAIEGLTGALAQELPRGLAAVAVNPGIIDTDMLRSCSGDSASSTPAPSVGPRPRPVPPRPGPKDSGKPLTVSDIRPRHPGKTPRWAVTHSPPAPLFALVRQVNIKEAADEKRDRSGGILPCTTLTARPV